jgi:hypothetical protein
MSGWDWMGQRMGQAKTERSLGSDTNPSQAVRALMR